MAGIVLATQLQLGDNATATQNFVWQTNNDGTAKLARGNVGATTQDILTVDVNGRIAFNSQLVSASTTATVTNKIALVVGGVTYYLLASTSGA